MSAVIVNFHRAAADELVPLYDILQTDTRGRLTGLFGLQVIAHLQEMPPIGMNPDPQGPLAAHHIVFDGVLNQHLQAGRNDVLVLFLFMDIHLDNQCIGKSFLQQEQVGPDEVDFTF